MAHSYALEHVMTYMRTHFLTLHQLSQTSEMPEAEIQNLILSGCIPGASYTARETVTFSSSLGVTSEMDAGRILEFHSPSTIEWIRLAEKLVHETSAGNLLHVAQLMHFHFESEFALALKEFEAHKYGFTHCFLADNELSRDRLHSVVQHEWNNVLKGAYGLCLRVPVSARAVVQKGTLIARISDLTRNGHKDTLSPEEKEQLIACMKEFNNVVSEFSPHDRENSTRKRYFDDLITKYGLQDHFQRLPYPCIEESINFV